MWARVGEIHRGGWSSESLGLNYGVRISTTLPLEAGQEFSEPECKWGQTGAEPSVEDVASPGLQQAGRQGNQCPLPPPASTL